MNGYGYLLLTGVLIPAFGVLIYRWRLRVEQDVRADPIQLLQQQLAKREAELMEIRSQDRRERDEYLKTLTKIGGAMDEVAADLRALREEERLGRAKVYDRLETVDTRLTVIETRLESR